MSFEPIRTIASRTIVLPQSDIDTDQIIPARFLTTTSRAGLGRYAFYDWRYERDGEIKKDNPLDGFDPECFSILVAGDNVGCGSSREHAPWALTDFGFKAVISTKIADIFKSNALKCGLLAFEVDEKTHVRLLNSPGLKVSVDLEAQTLELPDDWRTHFDIDPFARRCLLQGVDPLGYLLSHQQAIKVFEEARR